MVPEGAGSEDRRKLGGRAGVVALGTMLSRVLGFARDVVVAAVFPAAVTDAFFVAFTIPVAFRQLFGEGAAQSSFLPVIAARMEEGEDAARRLFARVLGLATVLLLAASVAGVLLATPLTEAFVPGLRARPEEMSRMIALTRALFPYVFFSGLAGLAMAVLNAHRRFAVAAFAPGLVNVGFLAAIVTLPPIAAARGVDATWVLACGALVGGLLTVVAQWPALVRLGYGRAIAFDLGDPGVREVVRRLAPLAFSLGAYHVDVILARRFLSELGPGAQSWFTWAYRVADFPQAIFAAAIATASLPALSTLVAKGERAELARTFAHGLGLAMYVAIPCSVVLVVLAEPIIAVFLQRGAFDRASTIETGRALAWQGGAIFAVAAARQIAPAFYALGDTRTPALVTLLDIAVFVGLATWLRGPFGHVGVSMAMAGSSGAQCLALGVLLRRRIGPLGGGAGRTAARTLLASVLAGAGAHVAARIAGPVASWLPGLLGAAVFGALFLFAGRSLDIAEQRALRDAVASRLRRRAPSRPGP